MTLVTLGALAASGAGILLLTRTEGETAAGDDGPGGGDAAPRAAADTEDEQSTYDPERLTGTWKGEYDCGRGPTDLTLTVDDYPDETAVGASWHFTPARGSEGPEGMFHMEGSYEDGVLLLEGVEWNEDLWPEGRDWVNLRADLSDRTDTEVIEGEILATGCSDVTLLRTDPDPWYVGTWEGEYECARGWTGTRWTIDATAPDRVEGIYEFFDIGRAERDLPYGSFHVTGTYVDRSLTLSEAGWIEHPQGYEAAEVRTSPDALVHPDRMFGTFPRLDECTLFLLERVEP